MAEWRLVLARREGDEVTLTFGIEFSRNVPSASKMCRFFTAEKKDTPENGKCCQDLFPLIPYINKAGGQ